MEVYQVHPSVATFANTCCGTKHCSDTLKHDTISHAKFQDGGGLENAGLECRCHFLRSAAVAVSGTPRWHKCWRHPPIQWHPVAVWMGWSQLWTRVCISQLPKVSPSVGSYHIRLTTACRHPVNCFISFDFFLYALLILSQELLLVLGGMLIVKKIQRVGRSPCYPCVFLCLFSVLSVVFWGSSIVELEKRSKRFYKL